MNLNIRQTGARTTQERLFASFILDRETDLEIALQAEQVVEATPLAGKIKPVPSSADYLEGFMSLRNDVIPIINLKKGLLFNAPNTAMMQRWRSLAMLKNALASCLRTFAMSFG